MNLFCRLLGHTWVPVTDNPKISWNNDDEGLVLHATASAPIRFFDECARCRERREVRPPKVSIAPSGAPSEAAAPAGKAARA